LLFIFFLLLPSTGPLTTDVVRGVESSEQWKTEKSGLLMVYCWWRYESTDDFTVTKCRATAELTRKVSVARISSDHFFSFTGFVCCFYSAAAASVCKWEQLRCFEVARFQS
jgi:hypothetical protein